VCSGGFQTKRLAIHSDIRVAKLPRIFLGLCIRKKVSTVLYLLAKAPDLEVKKPKCNGERSGLGESQDE